MGWLKGFSNDHGECNNKCLAHSVSFLGCSCHSVLVTVLHGSFSFPKIVRRQGIWKATSRAIPLQKSIAIPISISAAISIDIAISVGVAIPVGVAISIGIPVAVTIPIYNLFIVFNCDANVSSVIFIDFNTIIFHNCKKIHRVRK